MIRSDQQPVVENCLAVVVMRKLFMTLFQKVQIKRKVGIRWYWSGLMAFTVTYVQIDLNSFTISRFILTIN